MEGRYRRFDVSLTFETSINLENTLESNVIRSAPLAAAFGALLLAGLFFSNFSSQSHSTRWFFVRSFVSFGSDNWPLVNQNWLVDGRGRWRREKWEHSNTIDRCELFWSNLKVPLSVIRPTMEVSVFSDIASYQSNTNGHEISTGGYFNVSGNHISQTERFFLLPTRFGGSELRHTFWFGQYDPKWGGRSHHHHFDLRFRFHSGGWCPGSSDGPIDCR